MICHFDCFIRFFLLPFFTVVHNEVQQQQQQQRSNGDGTLSPTSNQLARWFSSQPELLAKGTLHWFCQFSNSALQFEKKNNPY